MKTITLLFIISLFINGVFGDEVLVMEGDSVTLHTNDADIQAADDVTVIWTYQKNRIARINRAANKAPIYDDDVPDWSFKHRLKMDDQTGDLTITNIKTTDSGLYEVQILVGSKNIQKSFNVKGVINPESDQLKSVSVKDGDYITLHTDVPDIKKYDVIQWRFQGVPVAQFNKSVSKISEDERFRDKLQLDVQMGSLKIKNINMDLSGLYEVDLTSSSYTIHLSFTVTVSGEVKSVSAINGDPVTIYTDVPDIKTYDQILLIFGCDDKLIAEANKPNEQFILNERFRDRLKLNDQTGDLTITKIKIEDAGDYELKMSSRRRTIQRRFRVNVSEPGLSPGAIAGISVFLILLAAAAAGGGVIYYRRKIAEAMKQLGKNHLQLKEYNDLYFAIID
nr:carcinoembryonic antigen-related cell adhesion molecule 1-like [Misgurnus anguillicaudatus]